MSKYKAKPNKGLLKRIKVTGKGKVKFKRAGSSHLNSHMSGQKIQGLRKHRLVCKADVPRIERMLHQRVTPG